MIRRLVPAFAVLVGLVGVAAGAAEPKIEPELAADPQVVGMIDGLGDNSSCLLPPIKTVGEFNEVARSYNMQKTGPCGRDYCDRMAWAPDRKRALYCGGNHGAPHVLNDAWEYDLPSNTWVLLYAPDPDRGKGVGVVVEQEFKGRDGAVKKARVLATKRGGPLMAAHTWWGLTYDPDLKAMLWMNATYGTERTAGKAQGLDLSNLAPGPTLWAFHPYERKWRHVLTEAPHPKDVEGATLEYIPELKGTVYYAAEWNWSGMWLYDPQANGWKDLKPNNGAVPYGRKDCPGNEAVMAWDSKSKVLVAQIGKSTFEYDLATNAWKQTLALPKESAEAPNGSDCRSCFAYDSAAGVCLLLDRSAELATLWSYRVGEGKWTKLAPQGPPPLAGKQGYYDPERNVLVVSRGAQTWLYRHRRAEKK